MLDSLPKLPPRSSPLTVGLCLPEGVLGGKLIPHIGQSRTGVSFGVIDYPFLARRNEGRIRWWRVRPGIKKLDRLIETLTCANPKPSRLGWDRFGLDLLQKDLVQCDPLHKIDQPRVGRAQINRVRPRDRVVPIFDWRNMLNGELVRLGPAAIATNANDPDRVGILARRRALRIKPIRMAHGAWRHQEV
jgi:hypothetical protein